MVKCAVLVLSGQGQTRFRTQVGQNAPRRAQASLQNAQTKTGHGKGELRIGRRDTYTMGVAGGAVVGAGEEVIG